jgi:hypothetical protein
MKETAMIKQKTDSKVVYVTIALIVRKDADVDKLVSEMDYTFKHRDIIGTELTCDDILVDTCED